jgi:hypothetical protein
MGDSVIFVPAIPHPSDPHYCIITARCGYGDDTLAYCQEHELAHAVVAEFFLDRPSTVMRNLLGFGDKLDYIDITCEELMAQTLQRYVRAGEEPIIADVDWKGLKELFLSYVNQQHESDLED